MHDGHCKILLASVGFQIDLPVRGPAKQYNFFYRPSRFLIYSRCASRIHLTATNVTPRGTRAILVEGRP
jgi:hypothetical protein